MTPLRFTVYGKPEPKGSTKGFLPKGWTRPIITSANPGVKAWADAVRAALQRVLAETVTRDDASALYGAAVRVTLVFHLPRPKSIAKRVVWPAKRPDLDKLIRATLDAFTGVLVHDDSQVVEIVASKVYAESIAKLDVLIEQPLARIEMSPARLFAVSTIGGSQPIRGER